MFLELIAAVAAGGLAAGLVLIVNLTLGMISGRRLPKWVIPVVAALAMFGFAVRMDYTWFDRTAGGLPETVEVSLTHEARQIWRPWSFVWPITTRFVAVDLASLQTNDAAPDLRIANMIFFARWTPPEIAPTIHDCRAGRMAPLLDTVEFGQNGSVSGALWSPLTEGDRSQEILCKVEE